ncbi:PAS domain-containing protein (plasmid) [Salipiger sp. H15]|uniref:histidine kinase n=1 Tax=Alloyangia sp. H15 TaxID=3029062 RepID=A0AAU8AS96_9RHOB
MGDGNGREDRLGFLLRLSDAIRPISDPAGIEAAACRMLAEHLGVARAWYLEIDETRPAVRVGGASPAGDEALADFDWLPETLRGAEAQVVSGRRGFPRSEGRQHPPTLEPDLLSWMATPLLKSGRLVAALCIADRAPRDWSHAETAMLKEVADRIWSAVEHARAEASLSAGQTRYRTLVDAMDEAVCVFERLPLRPDGLRDYRYITMNPAMQAMFGIPDLSGQSIRDNFPDEVEDWYDDYDHVLDTGKAVRFERGSVPQGMVLEMFVARIEDGSGRNLMAVIRDVTRRKRDEDALRESEARKEFLLRCYDRLRPLGDPTAVMSAGCELLTQELGADLVTYAEVDGEDYVVSREFRRAGPVCASGALPIPDLHGQSRAALEAGRTVVIGGDAGCGAEPGDAACDALASVAVPMVKDDRLVAVLGVARAREFPWTPHEVSLIEEVAERTWSAVVRARSVKVMRESEERLRALVTATSEVVYRMSPDWRIMWQLDGRGIVHDTSEPTTDWLATYVPPEDRAEVMEAIRRAIESKSAFQLEHRVLRPDGTLGWTFSRAIPLLDEGGGIVEWFGAASDTTAHRQAVEALAHSQRLEAAGRLAGAIAHDFNNLLTVIIGNIELSEIRTSAEERIEYLDKALKAAQLGERLNQRLVTWAGQVPMRPEEDSMNNLVRETAGFLDRSIGERFTLVLDLAEDLWPCFVDPAHVDSLILNLVVNARDAMPDGGEIRLATSNAPAAAIAALGIAQAKPGDYVCLSVSDEGTGMTEEVRRQALEPFFSTKRHGTGVGLGLFSVNSMMHQSGGFLDFDSAPGRGTTFRLYFPRSGIRRDAGAPGHAILPKRRASDTEPLILVVEDQKAVRDATRGRVQALGYRVLEAVDAEEALAILRTHEDIRLVFSDVVMPGELSGRDLARRILSDFPGIEVLLTTGYSSETSPASAEDPSAGVPVLTKPYRLQDLAQALGSLLARPGG